MSFIIRDVECSLRRLEKLILRIQIHWHSLIPYATGKFEVAGGWYRMLVATSGSGG
jgi:hypothetical protein